MRYESLNPVNGKTTTVRILGTLISPTSGSATVAGIPVGPAGAAEIRQRIAVMPESPGLYQRLTVTENLEYFARLYGLPRREERITEALAAVGLTDRAHDLAGSLSKGLRQRAALARSLLNGPAVMFLDEPASGLDPVAAHEVHGLIAGLRDRGVTVFLTTHRLEGAERLCDRMTIMSTTLRTIGRPEDLRAGLFAASLDVTVTATLADPGRGLRRAAGRAGVEGCPPGGRRPGWVRADCVRRCAGGACGDPGTGRRRGRRAVDRSVAAHAGGRLPPTGQRHRGQPAMSASTARGGAVIRAPSLAISLTRE